MLAEQFDCVTIFYGEIIGFTALISDCSASEVCLVLAWSGLDITSIINSQRNFIDHRN